MKNREVANETLKEVVKLIKILNVKYYLWYGTALGFYRDGDFIKWDVKH